MTTLNDIKIWAGTCHTDPTAGFWSCGKALDEQLAKVNEYAKLILSNQIKVTDAEHRSFSQLIEAKRQRIRYLRAGHGLQCSALASLIALTILIVGVVFGHTQKSAVLGLLLITYHLQHTLADIDIVSNAQEIRTSTIETYGATFVSPSSDESDWD